MMAENPKPTGLILGLRCPPNVKGLAADPQPDWCFNNLLSELATIEKKNLTPNSSASSWTNNKGKLSLPQASKGFVMNVEHVDFSDEIEPTQHQLMDRVDSGLSDLAIDLQLTVSDDLRFKVSAFETQLLEENRNFTATISQIERHRESQLKTNRAMDLHYRRSLAEALDNHLTTVQRDHEHMSQLEERQISDDLQALHEEKLRQEIARADEEARFKVERAKSAATKAEKQAQGKHAAETFKSAAASDTAEDPKWTLAQSKISNIDAKKVLPSSARNIIRASENALELEKRRQEIYNDLSSRNEVLKASSNQDYNWHEQNMRRCIKTISASVENIKTRAEKLVTLINNSPEIPRSISVQIFAEKVLSSCKRKSSSAIFATSCVIVLVASKIPEAMDILLAELNKACIYSVPKHIDYSEVIPEATDDYIEKLASYMKLYGALVQTDVGVQNLHGLREGWAWLARFLNALPPNLYTAVALNSFLELAGFALYQRYKNQFEKLMKIIALHFIGALQEGASEFCNAKLKTAKLYLLHYVECDQFKQEPEWLQLKLHLVSNNYHG